MALPLLNDVPKYTLKIPSTGKSVKYRPYLVKEEKILLLAKESKDQDQIMEAVSDTVRACTADKVRLNDLTTFDLEYLFVKIRAKSVGETVNLVLPCSECKTSNETSLNLDEVQCPVDSKKKNVIKIDDDISVEMKYPSYVEIERTEEAADAAFNIMASSLKAVLTKDERIDVSEEPRETVLAFLESMTGTQFAKLSDFVRTMPQVEHHIIFDCVECGHHNDIEVRGMQSFF